MDSLVKTLAREGFTFEVVKDERHQGYGRRLNGPVAVKQGERFGFSMREGYHLRRRTASELSQAEKERKYLSKRESLPNGKLTFEFVGQEWGLDKTFQDHKDTQLEANLAAIVRAFVEGVEQQKDLRNLRSQEERQRREQEHLQWMERDRIRKEREALDALLTETEQVRRFRAARRYIVQLQQTVVMPSPEGSAWFISMLALLERYDPAAVRKEQLLSRKAASDDQDDE